MNSRHLSTKNVGTEKYLIFLQIIKLWQTLGSWRTPCTRVKLLNLKPANSALSWFLPPSMSDSGDETKFD